MDDILRNTDLGLLGSQSPALHWPEDYEVNANLGQRRLRRSA